jgi:phosphatidylglycerophosphate synthase
MRDERSFPESAAEFDYEKSARKSEDHFSLKVFHINRYINRPLASLIVRAVYRTRVTPNQLTYLSFAIGLVAAYFFFKGRPSAFVVGGILTEASSVVDCADGMLARARDQMSEFGSYLDLFLDRINEFFLMAGAVVGYFYYSGRANLLILGSVAMALYFLQTSLYYLTKNYLKDGQKGTTAENRGWLLFFIFLFAVLNRMDYGIYVLFVQSVVVNLYLMVDFFRFKKS